MPENFRSSVNRDKPDSMACLGEEGLNSFPCKKIFPKRSKSVAPKRVLISSDRPAPMSPENPKISPSLTEKEISFKIFFPLSVRHVKCDTSKTVFPKEGVRGGYISEISSPTMSVMIWVEVADVVIFLATRF